VYTDGSRMDDESAIDTAIFLPELDLTIKHKLPSDTSIVSAEAWAIYQALILIESSTHASVSAAIFSDSRRPFFFHHKVWIQLLDLFN